MDALGHGVGSLEGKHAASSGSGKPVTQQEALLILLSKKRAAQRGTSPKVQMISVLSCSCAKSL
jgi:hypothetical protein